jgi:hypothetical protein
MPAARKIRTRREEIKKYLDCCLVRKAAGDCSFFFFIGGRSFVVNSQWGRLQFYVGCSFKKDGARLLFFKNKIYSQYQKAKTNQVI